MLAVIVLIAGIAVGSIVIFAAILPVLRILADIQRTPFEAKLQETFGASFGVYPFNQNVWFYIIRNAADLPPEAQPCARTLKTLIYILYGVMGIYVAAWVVGFFRLA